MLVPPIPVSKHSAAALMTSMLDREIELFKTSFNTQCVRIMRGHVNIDLDDIYLEIAIRYDNLTKYYHVRGVAFDLSKAAPDLEFETRSIPTIINLVTGYREQYQFDIEPGLWPYYVDGTAIRPMPCFISK